MIDHVSIAVSDLIIAAQFYDRALAPLGMERVADRGRSIGFGKTYPELWLNLRDGYRAQADSGHHICLRAPSETAVQAFHEAAVAGGGKSDKAPGSYNGVMTTYHCAFILDLDGNKIEVATFPRP